MVVYTAAEDHAAFEYNKRIVIASSIVVFIISNTSYVLRLLARRKSGVSLKTDDWLMGIALPITYIPAICDLYGLTVGLGHHESFVSKPDLRKFDIALFVLQRAGPISLSLVRFSILVLYVRIFPTKNFRRVAFVAGAYTLSWAIGSFIANLFECRPVSFFWNKNQDGHCIKNALLTIGLTNGVISFVNDVFILAMPIPMIWKLQMDRKRKITLTVMFGLGSFVCLASIFRFIALAKISTSDITYTQVGPGVWTYIEQGVGVTSGNLPLLRPIFGRMFGLESQNGTDAGYGANTKPSSAYPLSRVTVTGRGAEGFHRMDKYGNEIDETGSETELKPTTSDGTSRGIDSWNGPGINVKTDVEVDIEQVRSEIDRETMRLQQRERGIPR